MPYINLHWKGYPHHLPKIRVASTPSVSVRNRSNAAAQQVLGIPLGAALEEKRKKQRFNFRVRRRRGRSSRASATAQARRQASQRARQNIQVFGWDTPNAELASKATTEVYFRSKQSTPRPPRVPSHTDSLQNESESVVPLTDGAGSSLIKRTIQPKKSKERYSLMHVTELPTKPQSRKRFSFYSDQLSNGSGRRTGGEYAHINGRNRAYDTRIDPNTRAETRTRSAITQIKPVVCEGESFKSSQTKGQQSSTSPESLEAVNFLALKSRNHGSDSPSVKSLIESMLSGSSRTPSQRKALRRFTREIELYLQAARALPRHSLVPSITATTISANTVLELRPYQSQFQSAGLAVTSKEQRGELPALDSPMPPPTPPKDKKWEKMAILSRKSRVDEGNSKKEEKGKTPLKRPPSFASGSTGTTVIGFTPPHEKSYPRSKVERKQPSLESDHTVLGFTPPHERMIDPHPPVITSSDLRPSTKRSLPWLRRPSQSPEASPTKKMSVAPVERSLQPRSSTPLQGWVPTFDSSPKPPAENERDPQTPEEQKEAAPRRSSASRWRDNTPSSQRIASKKTGEKAFVPPQSAFPGFDDAEPCHHISNYVNTAVQADIPDLERFDPEVENVLVSQLVELAPIPTGRSKTLPVPPVQISDPDEEFSAPPNRQPPPPPLLCSQCAGPLDTDLRSGAREFTDELDLETEAKKPARTHACTSRSFMLCQQCFPSRQVSLAMLPLQVNSPVEVSYLSSSRRSTRPIIPTGPVAYLEETTSPNDLGSQTKQCLDSVEDKEMHDKIVKEALAEFTKKDPVADPMKRPSIPRLKLKPTPKPPISPKRPQKISYVKPIPMLAQRPLVIAAACPLDHVAASSTSLDSLPPKSGQVTDKQVFRGLHVATAAACDEDVDKWIEEITGTGVRKFLADLSAFEGLGVNTLANVAKRAAKQRREQLKAWEEVRERRLASQSREMDVEKGESEVEDDDGLRAGGFVIGDQGVCWNGGDEEEIQEDDTLIGDQGVKLKQNRD